MLIVQATWSGPWGKLYSQINLNNCLCHLNFWDHGSSSSSSLVSCGNPPNQELTSRTCAFFGNYPSPLPLAQPKELLAYSQFYFHPSPNPKALVFLLFHSELGGLIPIKGLVFQNKRNKKEESCPLATSAFHSTTQSPWGKEIQWLGYFLRMGKEKIPLAEKTKHNVFLL